jgi:hypothetical protein
MPLALMTDTFQYYRPVLEGILIDYRTPGFRHNIWIDWTSRQSYRKREAFLLGFSGYAERGMLIWQHHFIMTHLAHSLSHALKNGYDNADFRLVASICLQRRSGFTYLLCRFSVV